MAAFYGINVNSFGIGTHHPPGFMRNRKSGGDYLFLHFLTPYRIHLKERVLVREAGECIIFSPNMRQLYGSDGIAAFGNDWMHISGSGVQPYLKQINLPLNALLIPDSSVFVPKHLKEISQEISAHRDMWELGVELRVKSFLLELSRMVNGGGELRLVPKTEEMHELLNRLRLEVQARCTEKWDIERMLEQVHMSRSKFVTLYRKVFGASPVNDLIAMRLELARHYLRTTDWSVTKIAETCGFSDVYYFCRQFGAKTGTPPGKFRKIGVSPAVTDADAHIWKNGKGGARHSRRYNRESHQ
jgi:AraC family transcriptional regulator of arabinose operon